jgi:lipoprotein-anchoring transpeptidase ErfK/SrfK
VLTVAVRDPQSAAVPESKLPAPPPLGLAVPPPRPPAPVPGEARSAPVLEPVAARRAPRRDASVVAQLLTRTPERTSNIVLVLGRKEDSEGRLWARVRLPVLPNGSTGWVPRTALGGYVVVRTRLVVDRRRLTATLYNGGRPVFRAPVGVGTPQAPTPAGSFYVRNRLSGFRSPFYGPVAFGTSARSAVLTDWPGGGFVGIHGTNRPDLVPGRVSHGCIRLRNADLVELARLMPVGTPLTIR